MKRKLDSYLASGLLEQVPDLLENLSVPQSSQSDIPKDNEGSSDRNRLSSILPTSPKSKQEFTEQGENADTSVRQSSDFTHSAKVSESIKAKSQRCPRTRKKLDSLSTPVEIKVCTATTNCRMPISSDKIGVTLGHQQIGDD